MDWSKLLTPEALATYVVFVLGLVVASVGFLLSRWLIRQRPRKVLLLKVKEASLLEIDPEVRDEIAIIYKGKPVKSLYLSTFLLQNASQEIVDNVEIKIALLDTDIMEVAINDPMPDRNSYMKRAESNNDLLVKLPFLNPSKLYSDTVRIKVFSLKPSKISSVTGGGRGWTVDFFDRQQLTSDLAEELSMLGTSDYAFPSARLLVAAGQVLLKFLPRFLKVM